jgi:hypothetical protein
VAWFLIKHSNDFYVSQQPAHLSNRQVSPSEFRVPTCVSLPAILLAQSFALYNKRSSDCAHEDAGKDKVPVKDASSVRMNASR